MPGPWDPAPDSASEGNIAHGQMAALLVSTQLVFSLDMHGPVIADGGQGGLQLVMALTRPGMGALCMTELVPMPEPWGLGPCSATGGENIAHTVRWLHSWFQGSRESALAASLDRCGPVNFRRGARSLTVGDGEDASAGGREVRHSGSARSLVALGRRRLGKQLGLRCVNMICVRILQSHTAEEAMVGTSSCKGGGKLQIFPLPALSLRKKIDDDGLPSKN